MAGEHRARVKVRFPDAPAGTCKHCGRPCAVSRRRHPECAAAHAAANDYRGAAKAAEGEYQRCAGCGRTEGETYQGPGDYPGGWKWVRVKIERHHPSGGLVANAPRDWTEPLCRECHQESTNRDRAERKGTPVKGRKDQVPFADRRRTWWGLVVVVVGLVWMLAPLIRGAWVVAAGVAVVAAVGGYGWVSWRVARRRRAHQGFTDVLAKMTHTPQRHLDLRVRRWSRGTPVRARFRYSMHFDDSEGSPAIEAVEEVIERKVGRALRFDWDPTGNIGGWRPMNGGEAPSVAPGPVEEPDRLVAVRERVEAAVRATIKGDVTFEWGNADAVGPLRFTIRYPSAYPDESPEQRQILTERVNAKAPGRWRPTWDTEENVVTFERRPAMPSVLPLPVHEGGSMWRLAVGHDEAGQEVTWNLKVAPHALVVGETGYGKTNTLRAIIEDATPRPFVVFGVDPKRIELTPLRGWPNVRAVASDTETMIALVMMLSEEMNARYAALEAEEITEDDLDPVLVVLDELTEFINRVNQHWKATGGRGAEHPVVEQFRSMARLGRSGRIHLLVGVQRPDAKVIGGEARDQFRFRVALGQLSQDGARMVFGRSDVGRDLPEAALGRATVGMGQRAIEAQTYFVENPRKATGRDVEHIERLRAAAARHPARGVEHINAETIAQYAAAMDDPEVPLPVQRPTRRKALAVPQPVPQPVTLPDIAAALEDGEEVWVDLPEGVGRILSVVEDPEDYSTVDVEVEVDGGGYVLGANDDTTFQRAPAPTTDAKRRV